MEVWKAVPGFDGWYEVSDQGRVRSWFKAQHGRRDIPVQLSPEQDARGYRRVRLRFEPCVYRKRMVHALILETFVGDCPTGHVCCHGNGAPSDNRLVNLRWGTPSENTDDKFLHGTQPIGTGAYNSRLTEAAVAWARKVYVPRDPQYGCTPLANTLNVSISTLYSAISGVTWKHVGKAEG
jgi:hypothetical protein